MRKFFDWAEKLSLMTQKLVYSITAAMVTVQLFIILYGVFFRYVLDNPLAWILPISKILLIWIGLLGIPIAFRDLEHVSVKALVYRLPPGARNFFYAASYILVAAFLLVVLIKGIPIALSAHELIMISAKIHIPKIWTMMAVPVAAFINLIHILPLPILMEKERAERERMLALVKSSTR